jgi:hypothetical protein
MGQKYSTKLFRNREDLLDAIYPRDAQRVRLPVIDTPDEVASSKRLNFDGEKQGKYEDQEVRTPEVQEGRKGGCLLFLRRKTRWREEWMRDRALLRDVLKKTPHASPRELAQVTGREVALGQKMVQAAH